jgi:nucleolar protein 53
MADPSTAPPLQPSQPSRKGKKAWRKHVDITQLEHGLAQARDEQIAG